MRSTPEGERRMRASRTVARPVQVVRMLGMRSTVGAVADRLLHRRAALAPLVVSAVNGRSGLEVGGPSAVFDATGPVPIYPAVGTLDNVNYAGDTLWGQNPQHLDEYQVAGRRLGRQFIAEAANLGVPSGSYDFLASSHALEHCANPMAVLAHWRTVVAPNGYLLLVVPHFEGTFDHNRPVTTLEHMRADRDAGVTEADSTHFAEFIDLTDPRRHPWVTKEELSARTQDNLANRGVHHHVFDTVTVMRLLAECGWGPLAVQARRPWDIFVLARRLADGEPAPTPQVYPSPFRSDWVRSDLVPSDRGS